MERADMSKWSLLTNHALVLLVVGRQPHSTLREIAQSVGITERAALSILRALEEDGLISRERQGRRNRYWLHYGAILREHREGGLTLLQLTERLAEIAQRA
jgi:DNA-binding MarR family transcriptional regulator